NSSISCCFNPSFWVEQQGILWVKRSEPVKLPPPTGGRCSILSDSEKIEHKGGGFGFYGILNMSKANF
ncbi:hypothetical protein ACOIC7_29170, partial [Klebsiella pneumoniae]|uniref:hypothetical protein n=1 Tax=Klebsiella pneumoniae TaxID=573 RepID=UPI003B5A78ED